mmetsp:Transcript_22305/g.51550  ORF Transcript_22305/g.51550 Transcript_22305/m.51550 type:complete len:152 (-) Transcript_22305:1157-1612(-)
MEEAGLVKPRLVAVVSEMTSVDGFIKYFGDGAHEVFLDESNGFKKALGSGKLGLHGLLYPSVWKNAERTKEKYPEMESDLKGNGVELGGSMVIAKGVPGEVLFAYNEKLFGDMASGDEIRKVFERISDNAGEDVDTAGAAAGAAAGATAVA